MISDAMGQDIIIGAFYGYSRRDNGIVSIVIGEAISIRAEKGTVSINIVKKGSSVYGNPVELTSGPYRKSSVTANSIFRLADTNTTW